MLLQLLMACGDRPTIAPTFRPTVPSVGVGLDTGTAPAVVPNPVDPEPDRRPRRRVEQRAEPVPQFLTEARAVAETSKHPPRRRLSRPMWSIRLSETSIELAYSRDYPQFCGDCAELSLPPYALRTGVPVELIADASYAWSCTPDAFPSACADQPLVLTKRNDLQFDLFVCGQSVAMVAGAHAGQLTEDRWRAAWMDEQRVAPFPEGADWDAADCSYQWADCDEERPALVCGERGSRWGREAGGEWRSVASSDDMCACSSGVPAGVSWAP